MLRDMPRKPGHRPGDIILDRYVPHLGPEDREIARTRLQQWMCWKLHIYMARVRADMQQGDSRGGPDDSTMEMPPDP